jgi:hypothetical protein
VVGDLELNFEGTGDMDITADNATFGSYEQQSLRYLLTFRQVKLQVLVNFSSSYQYSFQKQTQLPATTAASSLILRYKYFSCLTGKQAV